GVVRQRGRSPERIQVELVEGLLLEAGVRRARLHHRQHAPRGALRLHAVHVAGDQLQLRVLVGGAGLVDDADPGREVDGAVLRIAAVAVDQVVVGPPGDATGLVGDARAVRAGALGGNVP